MAKSAKKSAMAFPCLLVWDKTSSQGLACQARKFLTKVDIGWFAAQPSLMSLTAMSLSLSTMTFGSFHSQANSVAVRIPHSSAIKTFDEPRLRQNPLNQRPEESLHTPPQLARFKGPLTDPSTLNLLQACGGGSQPMSVEVYEGETGRFKPVSPLPV